MSEAPDPSPPEATRPPAEAAPADVPSAEAARRKRAERLQIAVLTTVLLAVGALAWSFQLREPLAVDATPLDGVPARIGEWDALDIPLDSEVEAILRADHNLQRAYVHPLGVRIGVYVGYYGTDRGGRPEHTPWVCYPNAGWAITETQTVTVDAERGLRAHEMLVEKNGSLALVHFWYRSHRSTGMLDAVDQTWDRFLGRLRHDRADGAVVRISTPLSGEEERLAGRSRLVEFGGDLDVLLGSHWPQEAPESPQG